MCFYFLFWTTDLVFMEIKSITRYPFGDIVKSTRARGDAKAGGFATRSRVLARLALLAQIGELARRLANYLWLNSSLLGRWGWRTDWDKRHNSPHVRESGKFLLVESGIQENFTCGIWNPGQWNPEYGSKNPESHYKWWECRIQVILTKTGIQYLESGTYSVLSRIQDCLEFRYMART